MPRAKPPFVRFHWKPVAGKASLVWDEAQKLTGRDPDFHRRDHGRAIEAGDYPEFELGLQLIPEENEFAFDFDLLDPTKLIPEALVPVCSGLAEWSLNRNPDNFFAENEQAASIPDISSRALISATIRCCRGALFSTPIRKLAAWVGRTSMKSPSTVRPARIIISSVTGMHRMDIDDQSGQLRAQLD